MALQADPTSQTWRYSPDLISIVNNAGVFIETNPAWQVVLGWSQAEILEMTFHDFLHPDDTERTLAVFEGLKRGDPALHFENRYRRKDGDYRWLSWIAVQEEGVFVCSARDITEDKDRESTLETIEDEVQLREESTAILGHDLRNPLTAIGSAVRIASREPHTEKTAEMFSSIDDSTDRMARLIDVTMDFAKARLGGGIPVVFAPCDHLADRFEQVLHEIRLSYPDRQIDLINDFDGVLRGDQTRLDQLLSNLLANAITHGTNTKSIMVVIREQDSQFTLSVTNFGEEIPDILRPTLFEPFVRANADTSVQGLGLGLYIASQIAAAHGGKIDVVSDDTKTMFTLRIPMTDRT